MKKHLILLAATAMTLTASSCRVERVASNDTPPITRTYNLSGFSAIEQDCAANVVFTQGDHFSVTAKGSQEDLDLMEITVKDNALTISRRETSEHHSNHMLLHVENGNISFGTAYQDVTVFVTAPALNALLARGSGDTTVKRELITDALVVNTLGSGDIAIAELAAGQLTANAHGSGDISIKHATVATAAAVRTSGSGDVNISIEQCREATIETRGSGDVSGDVHADGHVATSTAGSGDVALTINGGDVTALSVGSGDVTLNLKCGAVTAKTSGSGDVVLSGTATSVRTSSSGLGDVVTSGLTTATKAAKDDRDNK